MNAEAAYRRLSRILRTLMNSRHLLALGCAIWFAWRVGTNPKRITYPCQRIALAQLILYAGSIAAPLIGIGYQVWRDVRRGEYARVAGIGLVVVVLTCGFGLFGDYQESRLRTAGSTTIEQYDSADEQPAAEAGQAVVSFRYDPDVTYGSTPPFDPEDNPAYDFVWATVEELGLGSASSPLEDLVAPGDTVLIKPNLVGSGEAVYSRPEVVRPLVDMAIAAGATEIYIGDGTAARVSGTSSIVNATDYPELISILSARHPGISIQFVDLNVLSDGWHWVSLGSSSSFAGSGYTDYDLNSYSGTLYGHTYYETADPQGVNPDGHALGWYAVNDRVLDADVIINVPKMKTHNLMINTLSLKNLVGFTLRSTYTEGTADCLYRIAHCITGGNGNLYYFNNDIFWRAVCDVNKIVLYADTEGELQAAPQRKYLNVIDGIQAMERSENTNTGGGGLPCDRNVVLAGIDPVAVDAVASRVMGYDYHQVPVISNASLDSLHPVGTNDPERIAVVGGDIDSTLDHVFMFNGQWDDYAGSLAITDFTPPTINAVGRQDNTVTADISGAVAAYVIYQDGSADTVLGMSRDSNTYSATLPGTVTHYFVRAQDEHFNTATAVDSSAPPVPVLASPPGGRTITDSTPWLDWSDVTDPSGVHYEIQVDDNAGFGSLAFSRSWVNASSCVVTAVLPDGAYYWRVRAVDGAANPSEWTAAWSFTVDATTPPVPGLASPSDGKVISDSTPWLDWSDVSDASGVHYQLQVDDDAGFGSLAFSRSWVNASSCVVTAVLPDGAYYWRVRAVDGAGNPSEWTAAWSFTVDATTPPVPVLASPSNGKAITDSTPWVDWSDVTDPSGVHYQIQVDDDSGFGSPEFSRTWINSSSCVVTTELADGTYYWKVRVVDGAGNAGAWTAARSVVVDTTAPCLPVLSSPKDGRAITDSTPWVDWSDATDATAVHYQIQVGNDAEFTSLAFTRTWVNASSCVVTTELVPGTYYWRVRAVDAAGNTSAWTGAWTFTIQ